MAWALHRVSGVAVWAFILLHVLDIWLVGAAPDIYDEVLALYLLNRLHFPNIDRSAPNYYQVNSRNRLSSLKPLQDPLLTEQFLQLVGSDLGFLFAKIISSMLPMVPNMENSSEKIPLIATLMSIL